MQVWAGLARHRQHIMVDFHQGSNYKFNSWLSSKYLALSCYLLKISAAR